MELNADIIYDNLSQVLAVERYGRGKQNLALIRPEFYNRENRELRKNHVYVSRADWLPHNPIFESGVVIVCVGGKPPMKYLTDECVCLLIENNDIFAVFNYLQKIFDKYDK